MAKFPYKNILEGVKHIWTKSQGPDAEGAAVTANPLIVGYKDAEGKATGVTPTNMLPVGDAAAQAKLADILTKLSADPATQTTLAAILEKIIAAPATEAKQTALNALIGEVQAAPTANTLLARLKSLEDKIAAIIAGTSPAVTQLSGRRIAVISSSYGQTLNVAGGGSGTTITVTPPTGELWRIKNIRIKIPAITGATTASHYFYLWQGDASSGAFIQATGAYNLDLELRRNIIITGTALPANTADQQRNIFNTVVTNANPLKLSYENYSDATQTGTMIFYITREVEYIV